MLQREKKHWGEGPFKYTNQITVACCAQQRAPQERPRRHDLFVVVVLALSSTDAKAIVNKEETMLLFTSRP